METEKEQFAKQYVAFKESTQNGTGSSYSTTGCINNITSMFLPPNIIPLNLSNPSTSSGPMDSCSISHPSYGNEEPIDLSTFSNKNMETLNDQIDQSKQTETVIATPCPQGTIIIEQVSDYYPKRRRRRRKFAYTTDGKLVLVPNEETLQSPASFSESKQLEILKAAKSLFSKRTRTLYHWMYPNAAKQQIKAAVASSWESLGVQEKDFYISQVLGRFGFPQSSLMVNPQLGGIKELPPIPETQESKMKSRELQSAISSIMPDNPMPPGLAANSLTFEEFEEINELTKKRRGRPPGSSNKKQKMEVAGGALTQDFKDDPELSQELEQFATMFNLSKI